MTDEEKPLVREVQIPFKWTLWDGYTGRPTISGPPIAYGEKIVVVREWDYEQAQKRSAELSKLVSSQGIRDMQQLDEIELLKEKLEIATEALEFYSKESNFTVIDEGRNYEHNCVAYELDPDIYGDCNIGTQARQALAKINNNNLTNEGDR